MSLSVSATARLQRQRRLQSSSPVNRAVTPASIKRRTRPQKSSSNDDVPGNSLAVFSFDEEVTAATTPSSEISTPPESGKQHGRSFSFSSFSVPIPSEPEDDSFLLSPANKTFDVASSPNSTNANIISPPGSPGRYRNRSFTHAPRSHGRSSPRIPSPTPSVGALMDNTRQPQWTSPTSSGRPGVSRSNSSRSVPAQTGSPKRLLSLTNGERHSHSQGDDMPMDELLHGEHRSSSSRRPPRRQSLGLLTDGSSSRQSEHPHGDPVSHGTSTALVLSSSPSSGGSSNNLHRMAQALQTKTRPAYMTAEEKHLWDVVQSLLPRSSSSLGDAPGTAEDSPDWEEKYQQRDAEWKAQQDEHDRALRAIQRVLADVTTEREETVEKLQQELEHSQKQRDDTIWKLTQKLKQLTDEAKSSHAAKEEAVVVPKDDTSSEQVKELQAQVQELQETNANLQQELDAKEEKVVATERSLQVSQMALEEQPDKAEKHTLLLELQEENEAKWQEIEQLKKQVVSGRETESLRMELQEKTSSLENAKMIITSLENANGSLAQELRAKLKEKEEELTNLSTTSADRKRTLDSLATELRELQRQQKEPTVTKEQLDKQREFCQMLEKNVKSLRQAAVQHEALNDQSSVDQISHIVSETFTALKQNLESWDSYLKNSEELTDEAAAGDKHIESALAKKNDETKVLRKELERVRAASHEEKDKLHQEIKSLREQLSTNMEVLAMKGRELSVLRDSLQLDDNDVGYISDDGSDAEGYDSEPKPVTSPSPGAYSTNALSLYGGANSNTADMNALTLYNGTNSNSADEVQKLKNDLMKAQKDREAKASELQVEKNSLANAKMIISSLEKANKSMLEDLRSRLQDSNTAIASLLEKSMEHEKSTTALKKELEEVKADREKEEKKSKAEMARLRDENLVFSMRLAAKDRELEHLQETLSQYEGTEVPMKMIVSSVEEKKEDADE